MGLVCLYVSPVSKFELKKYSCVHEISHHLCIDILEGKERQSSKRRGPPRKKQNLQGKKLFDDQSSSEEDSISESDQDPGADEEKQEEEDEEDLPLIHSLRASSKLRSIKVSKDDKMGQTKTVDSGRGTDDLSTPKTSGTIYIPGFCISF